MGCDYIIERILRVYYTHKDYFVIQLSRVGGYYVDDYFDIYDPDYAAKILENERKQLIPQMSPIVIYEDSRFKTPQYANKYKMLVEDELAEYDKQWSDIVKIVKVEERYKRDG
jgi:hypothetical protein